MRIHFSERKYHLAVKLWLKILLNKNLIAENREALVDLLRHCETIGMISKNNKKTFERFIIMKKTIHICGHPLEICFSKTNYEKFLNNKTKVIESNDNTETVKNYIRLFRKLGFLRSKRFRIVLKNFVSKFSNKELKGYYGSVMKNLGYFSQRKKSERDHFPPRFIYRFAKDEHIRKLSETKKPIWAVLRGLHRKSISTRMDNESEAFRAKQRDLFSHGKYYEAIHSYINQYITQGTIHPGNKQKFEKVIHSCSNIGIISPEQQQILINYLQIRLR